VERRVEVTTITVEGPAALADLDPDRLLAPAARTPPAER
jgi:hypothetical protein